MNNCKTYIATFSIKNIIYAEEIPRPNVKMNIIKRGAKIIVMNIPIVSHISQIPEKLFINVR